MHLKCFTTLAVVVVLASLAESRVNILDITTKQVFDIAVLRNIRRPVIAYFTKPSCTICNTVQTRLEEFARENEDTLNLAIVNLEKHPELKDSLKVDTIGTTRTYHKGTLLGEVKGPVWVYVKKLIADLA